MIVEEEQNGEKRAEYGKQQLQQISDYLTTHYGKGFDITNIRRIRLFYLQFPIRDTLCLELSWSYYRCLLHIENQEAISQNWSVRTLDRQISVLYYEQLLALQEKNLVIAEAKEKTEKLADNIKNYLRAPYILDFLNLSNKPYHESNVEESLINNIQHLLLELGKGFAFVEHQQRIRFDDEDFYINLVFYNFKLKYFLLIDIKLEKLKHQDIGQMIPMFVCTTKFTKELTTILQLVWFYVLKKAIPLPNILYSPIENNCLQRSIYLISQRRKNFKSSSISVNYILRIINNF